MTARRASKRLVANTGAQPDSGAQHGPPTREQRVGGRLLIRARQH